MKENIVNRDPVNFVGGVKRKSDKQCITHPAFIFAEDLLTFKWNSTHGDKGHVIQCAE